MSKLKNGKQNKEDEQDRLEYKKDMHRNNVIEDPKE